MSINYVKCLNVKINEKMKDNFKIVTSMEKKRLPIILCRLFKQVKQKQTK